VRFLEPFPSFFCLFLFFCRSNLVIHLRYIPFLPFLFLFLLLAYTLRRKSLTPCLFLLFYWRLQKSAWCLHTTILCQLSHWTYLIYFTYTCTIYCFDHLDRNAAHADLIDLHFELPYMPRSQGSISRPTSLVQRLLVPLSLYASLAFPSEIC
jgi:hypothetical protein